MPKGKQYNLGISLLKIIACVAVVYCHFGGGTIQSAVPVFMTLAFLSSPVSDSLAWRTRMRQCCKRFRRLLLPFWFWGMIGLFVWPITTTQQWNLWDVIIRFISQMILGSPLNSPLYFIFILLVLTGLFSNIGYNSSLRYICIYLGMCMLSFGCQYMGINYLICCNFPSNAYVVFGRICELLPYASIGVVLQDVRRRRPRLFRKIAVIMGGGLLLLITIIDNTHANSIVSTPNGFGYQGLLLFCQSISVVLLFVGIGDMIPYALADSKMVFISMLTPGIYYSHKLVGEMFNLICPMSFGYINVIWVFVISMCVTLLLRKTYWFKVYVV